VLQPVPGKCINVVHEGLVYFYSFSSSLHERIGLLIDEHI